MSLVNKEVLKEIKAKHKQSKNILHFETAYRESTEALSMAVTLLEQIDFVTQNFEFEVKIKDNK